MQQENIQKKYHYLDKKNLLGSQEVFVEWQDSNLRPPYSIRRNVLLKLAIILITTIPVLISFSRRIAFVLSVINSK
jgi:hypothetical protein